MVSIKVKKSDPSAVMPKFATDGSIAFDVFGINIPDSGLIFVNKKDGVDYSEEWKNHAEKGATAETLVVEEFKFDTGLSFQYPKGYGLFAHSRSGHGFTSHLALTNSTGLIDQDFTGNVRLSLAIGSKSTKSAFIAKNHAIAQLALMPVINKDTAVFEEVVSLDETERGAGGFGSTDKKSA